MGLEDTSNVEDRKRDPLFTSTRIECDSPSREAAAKAVRRAAIQVRRSSAKSMFASLFGFLLAMVGLGVASMSVALPSTLIVIILGAGITLVGIIALVVYARAYTRRYEVSNILAAVAYMIDKRIVSPGEICGKTISEALTIYEAKARLLADALAESEPSGEDY